MLEIKLKNAIYYFKDEHYAISILIIIICLLFPVSLYVCCQGHKKYREQSLEKKECYLMISRIMLLYTFALIFSLLFRFMTMDSEISVDGNLYYANLELDCSDKPFDCCSIYEDCRLGPINNIEYDSYVFNIEKGDKCPTLSDLVMNHISHGSINCEDTEYGCCYIRSSCDSYINMNITSYNDYEKIINKGFPYGYINMYEEKIDNEGTNCKGVEELVDEYYTDLENYSTNWMLLMMIILIISTSTPCIIYREKIKVFIKEQMRDKFINLLGNVYGMERVYHEEGELDELEDYDSVDEEEGQQGDHEKYEEGIDHEQDKKDEKDELRLEVDSDASTCSSSSLGSDIEKIDI